MERRDHRPRAAAEPHGVGVELGQTMPSLDQVPVLTETAGVTAARGQDPSPAAGETTLPVISELGRSLTAVSEERASARSVGVGGSGSSFARHSTIGAGLSFTGTALLDGAITVAGEVRGDLQSRNVDSGLVTITETGHVVGDIRARNISVLGKTQGTLDAPGGKVSLHDTASVSGRIRYAHLQVNGADLNAQLERVRSDDKGESQS